MSPIRLRLKEFRELRGLSVLALAKRAGIRRQTIMAIEKQADGPDGNAGVGLGTVETLAKALDIDVLLLIDNERSSRRRSDKSQ